MQFFCFTFNRERVSTIFVDHRKLFISLVVTESNFFFALLTAFVRVFVNHNPCGSEFSQQLNTHTHS